MQSLRLSVLIVFTVLIKCIASEFNLTIVHISDFHSQWFEFNEHGHVCNEDETNRSICFGGFPRLLTKVRELREKEKNVIVLSTGEFFYGNSINSLHGWKLANILLPKLQLNAMSLSNHDFGRGILELSAYLYKLDVPVLCANMRAKENTFIDSRINGSVILTVANEKIGIIGYLNPQALTKSRTAVTINFYPEIPSILDQVNDLKSKGVNKIIALGHSGYHTDLQIAEQVPGVDVVVGGDSDTELLKEKGLQADDAAESDGRNGHYPFVVGKEGSRTLVLHVPQHGKYIGVVRMTFDDKGNVIKENGEQILLDKNVLQDGETLHFLKNLKLGLDEFPEMPHKDKVLAWAESDLDGKPRNCRMKECSLGNFVIDALSTVFKRRRDFPLDGACINSGLIRHSIPAGNITMSVITHSLLLGDIMERVRMTGSELKEMLEHSVESYDHSGVTASGAFLQLSGIRVIFDLNQPVGNRVNTLMIRSGQTYEVVKPNKNYYILLPGFIRRGQDGFREQVRAETNDLGEVDFSLLIDYLRDVQSIKPNIDKRISFHNENCSSSSPEVSQNSDDKAHNYSSPASKSINQKLAQVMSENGTQTNKTHPDRSTSEEIVPEASSRWGKNIKISTLYSLLNSSLNDLERNFFQMVVFESIPEKSVSSIENLEKHLKNNIKNFLKVETISMDSAENLIPDYRKMQDSQNGEVANSTIENTLDDSFKVSKEESSSKEGVVNPTSQTKQNHYLNETATDSFIKNGSVIDVSQERTTKHPSSLNESYLIGYKYVGNSTVAKISLNNDGLEETDNDDSTKITTESDFMEAQSMQELLTTSIVQSIMEKVMKNVPREWEELSTSKSIEKKGNMSIKNDNTKASKL